MPPPLCPFPVGSYLQITSRREQLLIIGRVTGPSNCYSGGFALETLFKMDPSKIDEVRPNQWPAPNIVPMYTYEVIGSPDEAPAV
jgi:hypothetical protein